jgi:hypothetical protein
MTPETLVPTVTARLPDFVASSVLVAVTVSDPTANGVKTPEEVTDPSGELHMTDWEGAPVPLTTAEQFVEAPRTIEGGEHVTEIPVTVTDGISVRVADADFVASATLVAVSVTVEEDGSDKGAVYVRPVPEALAVADNVPHPFGVAHDAAHVTPFAALSLLTVAVNICWCALATLAVCGVTETLIGAEVGAETWPVREPRNSNELS